VKQYFGQGAHIYLSEQGVRLNGRDNHDSDSAGQQEAAQRFENLGTVLERESPRVDIVNYYLFFGLPTFDTALVTPIADTNSDVLPDSGPSARSFRPAYCVLTNRPGDALCSHTGGH
jgi:hypothetical protein